LKANMNTNDIKKKQMKILTLYLFVCLKFLRQNDFAEASLYQSGSSLEISVKISRRSPSLTRRTGVASPFVLLLSVERSNACNKLSRILFKSKYDKLLLFCFFTFLQIAFHDKKYHVGASRILISTRFLISWKKK